MYENSISHPIHYRLGFFLISEFHARSYTSTFWNPFMLNSRAVAWIAFSERNKTIIIAKLVAEADDFRQAPAVQRLVRPR